MPDAETTAAADPGYHPVRDPEQGRDRPVEFGEVRFQGLNRNAGTPANPFNGVRDSSKLAGGAQAAVKARNLRWSFATARSRFRSCR